MICNENRDKGAINALQNKATYPRNKVNNENKMLCFNCNKYGYMSMTCPEPRKILICKRCGEKGDTIRYCKKLIDQQKSPKQMKFEQQINSFAEARGLRQDEELNQLKDEINCEQIIENKIHIM